MTRDETKREIQRFWIQWPERKILDDDGAPPLLFYGELQNSNALILQDGDFGPGDPYQIVKAWIIELMRTWGIGPESIH